MSDLTGAVADLKDDDVVMIFRMPQGGRARRTEKVAWKTLKAMALQGASAGPAGKSAYQIAVDAGFQGSQAQWLAALKGQPGNDGDPGKSAFQSAQASGFTGTEAQWIASLKGGVGDTGKSAFQIAQAAGYTGTEAQWLTSLKGSPGKDGAGIRAEQFTGTVGAGGIATIALSPAFTTPLVGLVVTTWSGNQMIQGTVSSLTKTSATVNVRMSAATVVISQSPFVTAPSGTSVTVVVFGY